MHRQADEGAITGTNGIRRRLASENAWGSLWRSLLHLFWRGLGWNACVIISLSLQSAINAEDFVPLQNDDSDPNPLLIFDEAEGSESVQLPYLEAQACEPWVIEREPLWPDSCLDDWNERLQDRNKTSWLPIGVGAWHLFHQDLFGRNSAYGLPGIPGTYFWYINADPIFNLPSGRKIGGHLELRLREQGTFRSFINQQVWPWEAYGYVQDEEWGTFKAGLLYRCFGLFWDGSFFGSAPYFNGNKLNADYGTSWEKTTELDPCFSIDSFVQFFFHEDQSNGSFAGADPESVAGYTQRNTGVVRFVPTWKREDGSVLAVGLSGMMGQIQSTRSDLTSQTISAYGVDLNFTRGPWRAYLEGQQSFGVLNPVRFVSGGPSNLITSALAGLHYTHGAVTYRTSYSSLYDANPAGTLSVLVTGVTIAATKNVDVYCEYVNIQIAGNAIPASNGYVFHSLDLAINWHF